MILSQATNMRGIVSPTTAAVTGIKRRNEGMNGVELLFFLLFISKIYSDMFMPAGAFAAYKLIGC
jgi:hypothetical protein